ncbi:MAG: cytochrome c-type biogenesis protein CcmH [Candidatus Aminicenantales bacterium]
MIGKITSPLLLLGLILLFLNLSFSQDRHVDTADIQKYVACQCGCGMTVEACHSAMSCSFAKAAAEEINLLVAQGKDKDAILKALVAKYGEKILAAPTKKGFNLSAWILPFLALLLGAYFIQLIVRKWVKARKEADSFEEKTRGQLDDRYKSTMEKELKEFEE